MCHHSASVHNTCNCSPDHSDMLRLIPDMTGNSGAMLLSHAVMLVKVLTKFTGNRSPVSNRNPLFTHEFITYTQERVLYE